MDTSQRTSWQRKHNALNEHRKAAGAGGLFEAIWTEGRSDEQTRGKGVGTLTVQPGRQQRTKRVAPKKKRPGGLGSSTCCSALVRSKRSRDRGAPRHIHSCQFPFRVFSPGLQLPRGGAPSAFRLPPFAFLLLRANPPSTLPPLTGGPWNSQAQTGNARTGICWVRFLDEEGASVSCSGRSVC